MNNFKATQTDWVNVEHSAIIHAAEACILELRARVEALEAQANHIGDSNKMVPPPMATDEELHKIWDSKNNYKEIRRAIYNHGVAHGREVAEPAPVAVGLVERVSWLIADFASRSKPGDDCKPAAVKIVVEVAKWLYERSWNLPADLLKREAGR
jgi:hypothetical protein